MIIFFIYSNRSFDHISFAKKSMARLKANNNIKPLYLFLYNLFPITLGFTHKGFFNKKMQYNDP